MTMTDGTNTLMSYDVSASLSPAAIRPAPSPEGAQGRQHTDAETYSKSILGPVVFELSQLNVAGASNAPADPSQSQYIVASNERFTVSLQVKFNQSPLTKLLMCLGTTVTADFGFEGFGKAGESNVQANIVTRANVYDYVIQWTGNAQTANLTPGLYEIGATVTVGPGNHPCAQYVFGYGYIEEILLQIYPA